MATDRNQGTSTCAWQPSANWSNSSGPVEYYSPSMAMPYQPATTMQPSYMSQFPQMSAQNYFYPQHWNMQSQQPQSWYNPQQGVYYWNGSPALTYSSQPLPSTNNQKADPQEIQAMLNSLYMPPSALDREIKIISRTPSDSTRIPPTRPSKQTTTTPTLKSPISKINRSTVKCSSTDIRKQSPITGTVSLKPLPLVKSSKHSGNFFSRFSFRFSGGKQTVRNKDIMPKRTIPNPKTIYNNDHEAGMAVITNHSCGLLRINQYHSTIKSEESSSLFNRVFTKNKNRVEKKKENPLDKFQNLEEFDAAQFLNARKEHMKSVKKQKTKFNYLTGKPEV